jgi:membrane protein DedA with SNARE-associated domain
MHLLSLGRLIHLFIRYGYLDLLGAACWVGLICSIGYFFGGRLFWLIHLMGRTGLILLAATVIAIVLWILVQRHRRRKAGR